MKNKNFRKIIKQGYGLLCLLVSAILTQPILAQQLPQSKHQSVEFYTSASDGYVYYEYEDAGQSRRSNAYVDLSPVIYSEVNLNHNLSFGKVHIGNVLADDENLNQFGLTLGGIRLDVFQGNGNTTSKIRSEYSGMDPYLFHGGLNQRYDYSGFAVAGTLSKTLKLNYAQTRIESTNLEERTVNALGLSGEQFDFTMMAVHRGANQVGSVFSFSKTFNQQYLAVDFFKQQNGAGYKSISYGKRKNNKTYKIEFQNTANPLFLEKNENRLVFSVDLRLSRSVDGFYATETDQDQSEVKKTNKYLIPGALVVAGVALSSGSSSSDASPRFASQNEAAKIVLNGINPVSVAQNREHGGYIYRLADGSFSSTSPIQGGPASILLPAPFTIVPSGAATTATYHTHAAFDPRFDNENFSPTDIASDNAFGFDGYLGTPAGAFKYHRFSDGAIITLGTIAN